MSIEHATSSLLDVLDRVLDKGIVVDAWVRVSLIGIELVTVEARVVVASLATYLDYSGALGELKASASQAAITEIKTLRQPPPGKNFASGWFGPSDRQSRG